MYISILLTLLLEVPRQATRISSMRSYGRSMVVHRHQELCTRPWTRILNLKGLIPSVSRSPCDKVPGSSRVPQPPWSFGFDSQTRGTRENRRTLCKSTGFLTGPIPHAHSFVKGPAVINTHTPGSMWLVRGSVCALDRHTHMDMVGSWISMRV